MTRRIAIQHFKRMEQYFERSDRRFEELLKKMDKRFNELINNTTRC